MSRLLIIDDEESICSSMSEYFAYHGFTVDTAREREEADRLIESTSYGALVLDLRLGTDKTSDGLEIIRLVHSRYPETKTIVLTAHGSAEMEAEAKRCGADVFLRKPKRLSEVARVIHGLLECSTK